MKTRDWGASRTLRLASAALLAVALGGLAGGCGYSLVGRASNLPADVREILIRPLENQTPRSQVEQFLTSAIADELVTRQRFAVVQSEAEADAVLSGAVTGFTVTPVTFDADGRATEYEITVVARMSFRRTGAEGAVLWSNERYAFRENYKVEVSETGYFDQEDTAIEEVADRFAETMVSDLLEGF
jgi:outer membrane lipopolysaccharide assembly protein LptE/RlpB